MSRCRHFGKTLLLASWIVSTVSFLSSCADVDVRRVKPDDYETQGFRYYLPRPYVVVNRPFPVAGADYHVHGTLKDGKVTVSFTALDSFLLERFERTEGDDALIPFSSLRMAPGTGSAARNPDSPGSGADAETQGAGTPPTPSLEIRPNDSALEGSTITPPLLPAQREDFRVEAVLKKGKAFSEVQDATVRLGLLPVDATGRPDPSRFLELPILSEGRQKHGNDQDGKYPGIGLRAQLRHGPNYTIALRFVGKFQGESETKTFLVHRTTTLLHAEGISDSGAGSREKSQEQEFAGTGKGEVRTSGDPRTDPLSDLKNDFFDIVLLPDFDQQYAIDASAGLGTATMDLGFENGWMVERGSVSLDNRELGKFLFRNIEKFVDLGVDIARTLAAPGLGAAEGLTDDRSELQALGKRQGGVPVLLRVRYVLEAQPGIYPILKPWEEAIAKDRSPDASFVFVPVRPYTVVAYDVRRVVLIEIVDFEKGGSVENSGTHRDGQNPSEDKRELDEKETREVIDALLPHLPEGLRATWEKCKLSIKGVDVLFRSPEGTDDDELAEELNAAIDKVRVSRIVLEIQSFFRDDSQS